MAWIRVDIKVDNTTVSGWSKNDQEFTITFSPDFGAGDRFKVGRKTFVSVTVTNVAGRSEQLLISGKEVNDDKPKKGRVKLDARRENLPMQADNGRSDAD